ncbi:MAG: toll/interleukin-1 receptor domain-containing protein [Candidatus Cybelea sp.]
MALQSGSQFIISLDRGSSWECRTFGGLSASAPVFVAISAAPSAQAANTAVALRDAIVSELALSLPGFAEVPAPGGNQGSPSERRLVDEQNWVKLLVLVGDDTTQFAPGPESYGWGEHKPYDSCLPVFPISAKTQVSKLIPQAFSKINAAFWRSNVDECVPRLLQCVGLVNERSKIFISYRQIDYPGLAIQLFDALARLNFDVFLDSFRIDPGIDFQERLTAELGNKVAVLVIESPHIRDSPWTTFEAVTAKRYGLSLIGLLTPDGTPTEEIDDNDRVKLMSADFKNGELGSGAVLADAGLRKVVDEVNKRYARALLWRRELLANSVYLALQDAGLRPLRQGSAIVVYDSSGEHLYVVSYPSRPPESVDFDRASRSATLSGARAVLVGLCSLMQGTTRLHTNWLAQVSQVAVVDEGLIDHAARQMEKGEL